MAFHLIVYARVRSTAFYFDGGNSASNFKVCMLNWTSPAADR
jgi:hypothetical protein